MSRPLIHPTLVASLVLTVSCLVVGCAGPSKLAQRSEKNLAKGDIWKAWQQATKALDREPMNPRAKSAVAAAGHVIAVDWQRRIHALAGVDSMLAAEQVLAFSEFRANAANYTTLSLAPAWESDERAIRRAAAHRHYTQGKQAASAQRPKAAYRQYRECERYQTGYRDVAKLADAAYERAMTRVAFVPFSGSGSANGFGGEVSEEWRDAMAHEFSPTAARFTRILGADAINSRMTVGQLGRMSREEVVRLGRKSGAERVVWGSVGQIRSETHLQYFREVIARRIVQEGPDGKPVVRWVDVPIEVVARVRDVSVDLDYEVISTRDGTSLAHRSDPRETRARVVWTSFVPEGELGLYSLVSEATRTSDPKRTKDVETRWKAVCGEGTTLNQVLAARREARGDLGYNAGSIGRFVAGTAFVFLKELPPAQELAQAVVRNGWRPLLSDLARLDGVDDVDLGVALGDDAR